MLQRPFPRAAQSRGEGLSPLSKIGSTSASTAFAASAVSKSTKAKLFSAVTVRALRSAGRVVAVEGAGRTMYSHTLNPTKRPKDCFQVFVRRCGCNCPPLHVLYVHREYLESAASIREMACLRGGAAPHRTIASAIRSFGGRGLSPAHLSRGRRPIRRACSCRSRARVVFHGSRRSNSLG